MNRKNHRLCTAVIAPALLALSLLTSSCVEPLDPSLRGSTDPNAVSLPIRLYIPGAMPATKAGAGDVSGVSPESQVYRVQVWMFDHQAAGERTGDTKTAVAYAEADLTGNSENMGQYDQSGYYETATWESDKIFRLPLMIPGYVLERSADNMKFDFYVLANAASVGSTAGRESTRGDLKALTFGYTSTTVDPFGPYGPKTGTTPTNALGTSGLGLPISGFFNKSKNASAQSPSVGSDDGVDLSFLRDKNKPGTNPPGPYTNDEINAMSPVVQLERAVSKIRFVFAAPSGMTGMSVTGIEVNGGLIPKQTYLFPREESTTKFELPTNAADATYDAKTISVRVPAPIPAKIVDPKYLMSTSEKDFTIGTTTYNPSAMTGTDGAQQYSDFLTAAVGAGYATETYVYLRESDKPITGTITYSLDGGTTTQTATFDMTAIEGYTPANTNFHRNHSWIVYAYFLGGKLFVKPTVAAWDDAPELTYTLKMNTNMRLFDSWLYRYDTDGKNYLAVDSDNKPLWNNWATSHMAVSSGRENLGTEEDPVWGRALRSPLIQLVTTGVADANVAGSGTFELRIDNSYFEIVKAVKNNVGVVTSYEASTDIFEESVYQYGSLTIPAGDDVYTYFYIVPKVGVTPSNPEAKVTLFYNDPVLGLVKVTFNYSSLPGYSDDSSEIWAYYFPADDYRIIKDANNKPDKLRMYYQDYNNPLVPTPVQ